MLSDQRAGADGADVDARLGFGWSFPLACQHLLAAYASIVVTPLVLAGALGWSTAEVTAILAAGLVSSGLCTTMQCLGVPGFPVGTRLPVVQGTTIAAVPPLLAIGGAGSLNEMFGATIAAGAFCLLAAPVWARLLALFPPLVTGTVITVIGISLMPVAAMWLAGGHFGAQPVAPADLVLGLGTMMGVVGLMRFGTGALRRMAILAGLLGGTVAGAAFGRADLEAIAAASWFALPLPFAFGPPVFSAPAVAAMVLAMVVTMIESTGDYLAVGEICGRPVDRRRLAAGLRAEGLGTMLGGCLNSFPYTTFSQNVGVIRVSGVRSRFVVAQAAVGLVCLGLVPKLGALAAAVPEPVLGGCGLVLFGSIACTGIEATGRAAVDDDRRLIVVSASLGLALLAISNPAYFDVLPGDLALVFANPITLGGITAVVTNLMFGLDRSGPAAPR